MTPTTHAVLVCVIFLCGMDETVLSQHGFCNGYQCFAVFQEPQDFPGAQKNCKDFGGELFKETQVLERLLSGLSGSYWLEPLDGTTAEDCSSVSWTVRLNVTVQQQPCQKRLDGFLCQIPLENPCSPLQAGDGVQVNYTAFGFELKDLAIFPQGTVAVAGKVGAKYLDTKHLCFEMKWMQAPWRCEVMGGGCEHGCNSTTKSCVCPAGQTLHPNNITCIKGPCADNAPGCQEEGDTHVRRCDKGYRLTTDGKNCVDIDECKEEDHCTGEGEECKNTKGSFECQCKYGYEAEDGQCVDVRICDKCEHLKCDKVNGVYECQCRERYRVSAKDRTKCEMFCTERDCLAICTPPEGDKQECFCPDGYVKDIQNNTVYCTDIDECESQEHCPGQLCLNGFGSYSCVTLPPVVDGDGSGSTPPATPAPPAPPAPPASAQPAALPSYIKTGSVMGITLFLALGAVLLYCIVRYMVKRCGKLELSSLKRPDMDIFYLQQVTTETYKRLSFDKQFKNDPQRLESH